MTMSAHLHRVQGPRAGPRRPRRPLLWRTRPRAEQRQLLCGQRAAWRWRWRCCASGRCSGKPLAAGASCVNKGATELPVVMGDKLPNQQMLTTIGSHAQPELITMQDMRAARQRGTRVLLVSFEENIFALEDTRCGAAPRHAAPSRDFCDPERALVVIQTWPHWTPCTPLCVQ